MMQWSSGFLLIVWTVFCYGRIIAVQQNFDVTCVTSDAIETKISIKNVLDANVNILCDLFDAKNNLINQQYSTITLKGLVPFEYIYKYSPAPSLLPGTYTVAVGIFTLDWNTVYKWIDSVCTFTVSTPSFTVVGSVSSSTAKPGDTVTLSATIMNSTAPVSVLVDIELYDTNGKQIFQWFTDNQLIQTKQSQTWTSSWKVPSANITERTVFNLCIGVFKPNWTQQYVWKSGIASIEIINTIPPTVLTITPTTPLPTTTTTATGGRVTQTVATVNGQICDVYSWPDSKGLTRTVSLKREGNGNTEHGGYAVQMTYKVPQTSRQVTINWDTSGGDGGFGYFVSHELYRKFVSGNDGSIAGRIFGVDDSPLGRYFQVTGQILASTNISSAAHRFTTTYSHYGTAVPVKKNANGGDEKLLSTNKADYKLYSMTISITWVFEVGKDYPRIDTTINMTNIGSADLVNMDFRGPYGVMLFDDGVNGPITNFQFGDRYHFVVTQTPVTRDSQWTWNTPNQGARYHALIADQYEMGLFEPKLYSESTLADNWNEARGQISNTYKPLYTQCANRLFPCDFPYQSLQYSLPDHGVTNFKKIAWGSTSFYGANITQVSDGPNLSQSFIGWPANKQVTYSLCLVLGISIPNGLTKTAAASKTTFNCATTTYT